MIVILRSHCFLVGHLAPCADCTKTMVMTSFTMTETTKMILALRDDGTITMFYYDGSMILRRWFSDIGDCITYYAKLSHFRKVASDYGYEILYDTGDD